MTTTHNEHDKRPALNGAASPRVNAALIENIDVTIETFLGETTMTIGELNSLKVGSVISLDVALTEVVELRVNGVRIAHGELVAVGDRFGVRVVAVAP